MALPPKCGVCGSHLLGYDSLNVVTCETCDAIFSVSGKWHSTYGLIQPLTSTDRLRARIFGAKQAS
jgi:hypothetical protein